ncbi:MAG: hypothetical protein NC338_01260 [Firmicutes bacterium]|nr:hypothetical protein [Bacillota bacterium]MCM1401018.1 hypothetical protein [Bacteroides sp.]MCM1476937.1 hypothetical protein [Bacteroides sp.]
MKKTFIAVGILAATLTGCGSAKRATQENIVTDSSMAARRVAEWRTARRDSVAAMRQWSVDSVRVQVIYDTAERVMERRVLVHNPRARSVALRVNSVSGSAVDSAHADRFIHASVEREQSGSVVSGGPGWGVVAGGVMCGIAAGVLLRRRKGSQSDA